MIRLNQLRSEPGTSESGSLRAVTRRPFEEVNPLAYPTQYGSGSPNIFDVRTATPSASCRTGAAGHQGGGTNSSHRQAHYPISAMSAPERLRPSHFRLAFVRHIVSVCRRSVRSTSLCQSFGHPAARKLSESMPSLTVTPRLSRFPKRRDSGHGKAAGFCRPA
jgi:hypothetical protein